MHERAKRLLTAGKRALQVFEQESRRLLATRKRMRRCVGVACVLIIGIAIGFPFHSKARVLDPSNAVRVPTHLNRILSLNGRSELLLDHSRKLSLSQVLSDTSQFRPGNSAGIDLGYSQQAVWIRMKFRGSASRQVAMLSLKPTYVDLIDVYVATARPGLKASDFDHYTLGDHRPLSSKEFAGLDYAVPIPFRRGTDTLVYIRAAGEGTSLALSSALESPVKHAETISLTGLTVGVLIGGLAVLLIVQILFYVYDREFSHLLLSFSTLATMMVYLGNFGVLRLLAFREGGAGNDLFISFSVWLALLSNALATSSILDLRRRAPWTAKLFTLGACAGGAGLLPIVLFGSDDLTPYGSPLILLLATLAMVQSVRDVRRGGAITSLHAIAYSILWAGLVLSIAQRDAYLLLPYWASNGYAVSSLLQTLLLTGAIAVRLRSAEAESRLFQKRALSAAIEAEQRAETLVAETTGELATAKQRAEDALRAELASKEREVRFMEVISHQYRTPLAVIRSNVDSISLSLPAESSNHRRLGRVQRAISRLVEVIEVNLSRSRLEGASFEPSLAPTSLKRIAEVALAKARDLMPASRIAFEFDDRAKGACVEADCDMLGIALLNVLDNAIKFSLPAGNPEVVMSCTVDVASDEGFGLILVKDRGIGIPVDEIPMVLNPSVRASNVGNTKGSGMGLSLVASIVNSHGGLLTIDSLPGNGTTVRIALPLAPSFKRCSDVE